MMLCVMELYPYIHIHKALCYYFPIFPGLLPITLLFFQLYNFKPAGTSCMMIPKFTFFLISQCGKLILFSKTHFSYFSSFSDLISILFA